MMLSYVLACNSPEILSIVLPPLYSQSSRDDGICFMRFYLPGLDFAWYAMEFDGSDSFFGYVNLNDPDCAELGYFSLEELSADTKYGQVMVDFLFSPAYLSSVKEFERFGGTYHLAPTREQVECFIHPRYQRGNLKLVEK